MLPAVQCCIKCCWMYYRDKHRSKARQKVCHVLYNMYSKKTIYDGHWWLKGSLTPQKCKSISVVGLNSIMRITQMVFSKGHFQEFKQGTCPDLFF